MIAAGPPSRRLGRPVRLAAGIWIAVAVVMWNGLYDFRISLGIREYLLQAALHELGRGPGVPLLAMMDFTVRQAVKFATFWTALILAAALAASRALARPAR